MLGYRTVADLLVQHSTILHYSIVYLIVAVSDGLYYSFHVFISVSDKLQ